MIKKILFSLFALSLLVLTPYQAHAEKPVILAELFTSEFCPACPPADALLEKLSQENHIIALGCHVTYFPGKSDLGRAACTQRQFDYVRYLRGKSPFTPQFVFNGQHSAVGVRQNEVSAALMKASKGVESISITRRAPHVFSYSLPQVENRSSDLWLVIYEGRRSLRRRDFVNVVDVMLPLGAWNGVKRDEVFAPMLKSKHAGFAIYAQDKATGAIIAAGEYRTN